MCWQHWQKNVCRILILHNSEWNIVLRILQMGNGEQRIFCKTQIEAFRAKFLGWKLDGDVSQKTQTC